ncbi:unnamed protein product, partial [Cyprideis torosa]
MKSPEDGNTSGAPSGGRTSDTPLSGWETGAAEGGRPELQATVSSLPLAPSPRRAEKTAREKMTSTPETEPVRDFILSAERKGGVELLVPSEFVLRFSTSSRNDCRLAASTGVHPQGKPQRQPAHTHRTTHGYGTVSSGPPDSISAPPWFPSILKNYMHRDYLSAQEPNGSAARKMQADKLEGWQCVRQIIVVDDPYLTVLSKGSDLWIGIHRTSVWRRQPDGKEEDIFQWAKTFPNSTIHLERASVVLDSRYEYLMMELDTKDTLTKNFICKRPPVADEIWTGIYRSSSWIRLHDGVTVAISDWDDKFSSLMNSTGTFAIALTPSQNYSMMDFNVMNSTKGLICKSPGNLSPDGASTSCPGGYIPLETGGTTLCYHFEEKKRFFWKEAVEYCKNMSNGDLLYLDSKSELTSIQRYLLDEANIPKYWNCE